MKRSIAPSGDGGAEGVATRLRRRWALAEADQSRSIWYFLTGTTGVGSVFLPYLVYNMRRDFAYMDAVSVLCQRSVNLIMPCTGQLVAKVACGDRANMRRVISDLKGFLRPAMWQFDIGWAVHSWTYHKALYSEGKMRSLKLTRGGASVAVVYMPVVKTVNSDGDYRWTTVIPSAACTSVPSLRVCGSRWDLLDVYRHASVYQMVGLRNGVIGLHATLTNAWAQPVQHSARKQCGQDCCGHYGYFQGETEEGFDEPYVGYWAIAVLLGRQWPKTTFIRGQLHVGWARTGCVRPSFKLYNH